MRLKLLVVFLLLTFSGYGRGSGDFMYPDYGGAPLWGASDTIYYSSSFFKGIMDIRRGNKLYCFSPDGNLVSITEIKPDGLWKWIDTNKKEHIEKKFILEGVCYLYYDDSTCTLAAVGEYISNERGDNWRYYDKKGRLNELSYHIALRTRTDYYDTLGRLIKEEDYTSCMSDNIKVREVQYVNGHKKVILDKMFIEIVVYHFMIYYMVVLFFFFFSRTFINYAIYSREDEKFPYKTGWFTPSNLTWCLFSFWFSNYKPENRKLVLITNTFTVIASSLFFGWLIIAAINGDV